MKSPNYKVHIIGLGPGSEDYLLPLAKRKIQDSDTLVGAKRLIRLFRNLNKEEIPLEGHFDEAVSFIKKYKDKKKIAVLVSGDPGFYSLLEKISKELDRKDYTVIPGISTLQLAFAKIGMSWRDAKIVSLHGRRVKNLACQLKSCQKAFLLTDSYLPPNKIAQQLLKEGIENRRAIILENLSYPEERITETNLKSLSRMNGWRLCSMIIEKNDQKVTAGKLFGIGIGPGDPKLLTLKAKEILDKVNTVFVPKANEDGSSLARSIVEAVVTGEKNFKELTFPMTTDKSLLEKYWLNAASIIANEINKGREVAFVTIGDPFIYSTYVYLLRTLRRNFPDIKIETVPGVSSFNAASSRANFSLVEGREKLAVLPVTKDLKGVREALVEFDSIVLMKIGSKLNKVISLLKKLGLIKNAVLISRVGHDDEKVIYNLSALKDKKVGYLSVILVRKDIKK